MQTYCPIYLFINNFKNFISFIFKEITVESHMNIHMSLSSNCFSLGRMIF